MIKILCFYERSKNLYTIHKEIRWTLQLMKNTLPLSDEDIEFWLFYLENKIASASAPTVDARI